ncbi:MAG: energy transducer TonB [Sphingopyxis sp.]
MAYALLTAPVAASAVPVTVITVHDLTPKEIRAMQWRDRRRVALCRSAAHHRNNLDKLLVAKGADSDTLSEVAWQLWDGEDGCRRDRALAIDVTRRVIDGKALTATDVDTVAQLAMFLQSRGEPADLSELAELRRIMWARSDYYGVGDSPNWSADEKRDFVARDDVWAFIDSPERREGWKHRAMLLEALLDPLSPRHDAARAVSMIDEGNDSRDWTRAARLLLEGKQLPADPVRAEGLLVRAAEYDDAARLLLLPILAPRLDGSDPVAAQAALKAMQAWASKTEAGGAATRALLWPGLVKKLSAPASEVQMAAARDLTQYAILGAEADRAPLLRWLDTALHDGSEAEKAASWGNLGRLMMKQEPGAAAVMAAAYEREGGLLDGGALQPANFQPFITADDYPARALRDESEGVVEAEAVIAPNGRVLHVVVTRSASPILDDIVQRLVVRRFRLKDKPEFAGHYVRAKLPSIQFRLPNCDTGADRTPAVEAAILVDGDYCPHPIQDVPLSVTTAGGASEKLRAAVLIDDRAGHIGGAPR